MGAALIVLGPILLYHKVSYQIVLAEEARGNRGRADARRGGDLAHDHVKGCTSRLVGPSKVDDLDPRPVGISLNNVIHRGFVKGHCDNLLCIAIVEEELQLVDVRGSAVNRAGRGGEEWGSLVLDVKAEDGGVNGGERGVGGASIGEQEGALVSIVNTAVVNRGGKGDDALRAAGSGVLAEDLHVGASRDCLLSVDHDVTVA